jgi:hypothetical protein
MKKIFVTTFFCFVFGLISSSVNGQQFLWTTNKNNIFTNSEIKVIPKEDVINKLLEYYENYECYFDFTGFSKEGFLKKYINSIVGNDKKKMELFKNSIYKIKDLNITSIKGNLGNGSLIMILIVSKNNFDMIVFSNEPDKGFIITDDSEEGKNKFVKFYNSLIEN